MNMPFFRTCYGCNQVFKSVMGRKQHQKNRRQPNCYRDGVKREIAEKRKIAFKHLNLWTGKKIPLHHESVFEKHGYKAFSSDAKQICLNVYQSLRNEGLGVKEVLMIMYSVSNLSGPFFLKN